MDFTAYRHALHGISGVHATAYDSAGEIDAGLTAGLFEGIAAAGIHNIVSGGNTGEFYSLTTDEVMRLHAIAAEAIGGRAGFTAAVARSQREAIHGCARDRAWRVVEVEAGGAGATLALHLDEPALPWRFDLVQRVTLGAAGVVVALDLTNRGAAPMPFGIGLHPWFCKTGDARLEFAPARLHRRDARGLPLPETDPQPGFTPGAGQNLRDLP